MRQGEEEFRHELVFIKCLFYSRYFPLLPLVLTQPEVKNGLIFKKWSFQSLVTDLGPHKQGNGGTRGCDSRMYPLPEQTFLNELQTKLVN